MTYADWNDKLQLTEDEIRQEFEALGIRVTGPPTDIGWMTCHCLDGEDHTPSGSVNYKTGKYHDHRNPDIPVQSLPEVLVGLGVFDTPGQAKAALKAKYRAKKVEKPDLELCDWAEDWADQLVAARPGVLRLGLNSSGGQFGWWNGVPVFALPIVDGAATPTGTYLMRVDGKTIGHGKARVLKEKGAVNGLIGAAHLTIPEITAVYWVEGGTDYLAGLSACENHGEVFIANPSGCGEAINEVQRRILATVTAPIYVIGDADTPGDLAAAKRVMQLRQMKKQAMQLRLPYEITLNHGKDLRDWLPGGYSPTVPLHAQLTKVQTAGESSENRLLDALGLEVVASADEVCCLYSKISGRALRRGLSMLRYEDVVGIAGLAFRAGIRRPSERDERLSFNDFLDAVAIVHSTLPFDQRSILAGPGIWRTQARTWALLQPSDTVEYVGGDIVTHTLGSLPGIRPHRQTVKWFHKAELIQAVEDAQDVGYRRAAVEQLDEWFGSWPWVDASMPKLLTGMYLAAWVQDGWAKRPYVVISGESATGKTSLLRLIQGLYTGLAVEVAAPTPAGFVQEFQGTMKVALVDEIDAIRNPELFYQILRTTTTGQSTVRGTPGQLSTRLSLRHLMFLSGITCDTLEQADLNRYVSLELQRCSGRFVDPAPHEIQSAGLRALASVLRVADEAMAMLPTFSLPPRGVGGEPARIWENHAIAFVMRAAMLGQTMEEGRAEAEKFWVASGAVGAVTELVQEVSPQNRLVRDILNTRVRVHWPDRDSATVMDLLGGPDGMVFEDRHELAKQFYSYGIRLTRHDDLAIVPTLLVGESGLLGGTWWARKNIRQLLSRLGLPIKTSSAPSQRPGRTLDAMYTIPVTVILQHLNEVGGKHNDEVRGL